VIVYNYNKGDISSSLKGQIIKLPQPVATRCFVLNQNLVIYTTQGARILQANLNNEDFIQPVLSYKGYELNFALYRSEVTGMIDVLACSIND